MRKILHWAGGMDLNQSPPAVAQYIHRQLHQITGIADPYRAAKARQNCMAIELLPVLRDEIQSAASRLATAARIAIVGNMIDMGACGDVSEAEVYQAVRQAASAPFYGEMDLFSQAVCSARSILYLADNAGEIAFDRLLIEQISPERVTLVVRGAPVLNDATRSDADTVGLDEIVEVMDNGSDAPGTILDDCSPEFRRRFIETDLIIAKGQGNFETLNDQPGNIFFLFKVKCPLVAKHTLQPLGTQVLMHSGRGSLTLAHRLDRQPDCYLSE